MARIELDAAAFAHNIKTLTADVSLEKIAIVLKDNAYGHGLAEMAELAYKNGIRHAVVRRVSEAEQIAGIFESVLVLAEMPTETPASNIHITLNALDEIAAAPKGCAVHLKVDSGMHRNGIAAGDLEKALRAIQENGLLLKGIFSHSRSGDELSSELFWQHKNFEAIKAEGERLCGELGLDRPLFHFSNSPTLLRFGSKVAYDRVRIGIAAYGYGDMPAPFEQPELRPVLKLFASKIASRRLRKGERVGYGGTGSLARDGMVSTYDLGYADGLFRYDGQQPFSLQDGTQVVGKISMDNLSLFSEVPEVCLIDDARPWAERFNTITYDVLVKLSPHIKRHIV